MKLRDYLFENNITLKSFAEILDLSEAHFSCMVSGKNGTSRKIARKIEKETKGVITQEAILSREALGFEGPPKRLPRRSKSGRTGAEIRAERKRVAEQKRIEAEKQFKLSVTRVACKRLSNII